MTPWTKMAWILSVSAKGFNGVVLLEILDLDS